MKVTKTIGILALVVLLITSCSSKKATAPAETTGKKPSLEVTVDVSGRTATARLKTDLIINPEHLGKARVDGEGHYHISWDDKEKQTISDNQQVVNDLSVGKHNVKVSLHNNDHTPYNVSKSIDFEVK
jgi:hypothetical protein